MDLGIAGKTALVCGSSPGRGRAGAQALGEAGVELILNARSKERLDAVTQALSQHLGRPVRGIVADVSMQEGRAKLLAACPAPDILVNNGAGPPPGDFRGFDEAAWQDAVRVSMITPIMMIRAVVDGMAARGWGRIINITSMSVKTPVPLLDLSNGARSGLTGFVAGVARQVAAQGVTINNLLPGRFYTERLQAYIGKVAEHQGVDFDTAVQRMQASNPMRRFGKVEEFGAYCAFIASQQAAFVTGQNLALDGGEYAGW
ncbi:MAG: SDR family oxidoreductase [Panacagrimonas sp.]